MDILVGVGRFAVYRGLELVGVSAGYEDIQEWDLIVVFCFDGDFLFWDVGCLGGLVVGMITTY